MANDEDKPRLKVVSENSQRQIDEAHAQDLVDHRIRELAANLIRVVRGAGKPHEVIFQCDKVVKAALEYRESAGHLPTSFSVASALGLEGERIRDYDSFEGLRQLATRKMLDGGMQVVASRLLNQLTQEHRGESQLYEGFRDLEHLYEEIRKQRAAEERARRSVARAKTKAKSAKKSVRKRKPKDPEAW